MKTSRINSYNPAGLAINVLCCSLAVLALAGPGAREAAAQVFPQTRLSASDAAPFALFGISVSIDGNTAVMGATRNSTSAGSAYVFVRSCGGWTQQAILNASDPGAEDNFGFSASIDGDTAVIGAYSADHAGGTDAGAAYVFVRSPGGSTWTQQAKLIASDAAANDNFGYSVSIDGDTAVIGAYLDDHAGGSNAGSAYVFVRPPGGTTWTQQAKLTASDAAAVDVFGYSVSINGNTAVIGALLTDHDGFTDAGSAYVFVRPPGGRTWTQQAKLTAPDAVASMEFGISVSIDRDTAVIGTFFNGAYVFVRPPGGTTWTQQAKLNASDTGPQDEIQSVAIDGDTVVGGAPLSNVPGAFNGGKAYVFARPHGGTTWTQQVKFIAVDAAAGDQFGEAVAIDGNTAVIGAWVDDNAGGNNAGSVYVIDVKVGCGITTCPPDINADHVVNVDDLLAVINGWGVCP